MPRRGPRRGWMSSSSSCPGWPQSLETIGVGASTLLQKHSLNCEWSGLVERSSLINSSHSSSYVILLCDLYLRTKTRCEQVDSTYKCKCSLIQPRLCMRLKAFSIIPVFFLCIGFDLQIVDHAEYNFFDRVHQSHNTTYLLSKQHSFRTFVSVFLNSTKSRGIYQRYFKG